MIGKKATFDFPVDFISVPSYAPYRGVIVSILRKLRPEEFPTSEPAYEVEAEDGWRGVAFEDELSVLNMRHPATWTGSILRGILPSLTGG